MSGDVCPFPRSAEKVARSRPGNRGFASALLTHARREPGAHGRHGKTRMIEDFIIAELTIWAAMIVLLPVAAAIGIALARYQADREVRERLRTPGRANAKMARTLVPFKDAQPAASLKTRRPA